MTKEEIKNAFIRKMIEKIENEINLRLSSLKNECDRKEFLRNNEYNKTQLEKHFNEYLTDRHIELMKTGRSVFNNITINAFNSYILQRNKELRELPKKNPYSDLDDNNIGSNEYRETNRWMK